MAKKDVNMLSGSITKHLLKLAVPLMLLNILTSLFNIVDMWMLNLYDVESSVSEVGAAGTIIAVVSNLVAGLSVGINLAIVKCIGRRDLKDAQKAAGTAVAFTLAIGLALMVIGIGFAPSMLMRMVCPAEWLAGATFYLRAYFVGIPVMMVFYSCAAILYSTGSFRRIVAIIAAGSAVKVVVTYVLVNVNSMGATGASLANIVSWLALLAMVLWSLSEGNGAVKLQLKHIRFDKNALRSILRVGVPAALHMGLCAYANVIVAPTVVMLGHGITTGVYAANAIDGVLYNLVHAISLATLLFVSQNVDAGNMKRATQSVGKGVLISVCVGVVLYGLLTLFSTLLLSFVLVEPASISYAKEKIFIISGTCFICGINDVVCAALRGMGKAVIPTVATIVFMYGLQFLWVYAIFPLMPVSMVSLYLVWPIGWALSIVSLLPVYFSRVKELKAKYQPEQTLEA